MSSVTTSTRLQRANFFASNSLTAMLKSYSYNKHPLITNSFFCIFLLIGSGIQCNFWISWIWLSLWMDECVGHRCVWSGVRQVRLRIHHDDTQVHFQVTSLHLLPTENPHLHHIFNFLFLFFFLRVQQFCQSFLFGKKKATIPIWCDMTTKPWLSGDYYIK